jgi:hypothetical protein
MTIPVISLGTKLAARFRRLILIYDVHERELRVICLRQKAGSS